MSVELKTFERCGFVPPTPGFQPCRREKGHDGPCAHEESIVTHPWLIWNVEHNAWWGEGGLDCWFEHSVQKAGRYSFTEAHAMVTGQHLNRWTRNLDEEHTDDLLVPSPELLVAIGGSASEQPR